MFESYATVRTPDLPAYRITADDRLWAGRAANFEGGDPADTLWTWTQRFSVPAMRRNFPTLKALIQAHSQPVNPIWRRTGSMCRSGGRYAGTDHCAERRLAARDRAATMSFSELRPEVQAKVDAWARGQLPNPVPRSVDFAAPSVAQSFLNRTAGSQLLKQAGNWFIGTRESLRWAPDHVTIVPAGGAFGVKGAGAAASIVGPVLVVGGAVAIAGALVYFARRRAR